MGSRIPQFKDRLGLWAWCITTFLGVVCLLIYLPMSTNPAMEALSEAPHLLSVAFLLATLGSLGTSAWLIRRPATTRQLAS
ncbi:MAG: hypothetical protein VX519_09810, partial [Myxococcota bacterium]|nr:hypothetical protein [Myxococcota bacterium]